MRILHMIPDIGISNGVMSVILNYAKAMPQDVVFDVVYFDEKPETKKSEIEALGGRVFKISAPSPKTLLKGEIDKLFKEHKGEWKALHIHAPHFAVFIAPYAKKYNIKKICTHCHSTWYSLFPENILRNKILFNLGKPFVDRQFACGRDAGMFWFKKTSKFEVLNNAIDCSKYSYDENIRKTTRKKLGVENKFVVGHIGRADFSQKNQPFLIEVFYEIVKRNQNAVLVLVGCETNSELIEIAKKFCVEDKILFLGLRNDVNELLQAFDVFVFPSFKEGLPVAVIEAQASSLPVIMSDSVTDEVMIKECEIQSVSLSESASCWAETAVKISENSRFDNFELLKKSGWDIYDCANNLLEYYLS